METKLTIENLDLQIAGHQLLRGINLEIYSEEILVILGPSGSGKSTLLRALAGLEKPSSGAIRINGNIVSNQHIFVPPHLRNIGLVFQDLALWPHLTAIQQLQLVAGEKNDLIGGILDKFELQGKEHRYPGQLSGGEQQRLAIARTLVHQPQILLLDEPLSDLDWKLKEEMLGVIQKLRRDWKVTVVFVSHDQLEAAKLADRIAIMEKGRIEQIGQIQELLENPATDFVRGFLEPLRRGQNGR